MLLREIRDYNHACFQRYVYAEIVNLQILKTEVILFSNFTLYVNYDVTITQVSVANLFFNVVFGCYVGCF